jgi:FKBP-type peptidyl-prolyl cis-trans isomerase
MRPFFCSIRMTIACFFIIATGGHTEEKRNLPATDTRLNAQISYALGLDIAEQLNKTMDFDVPSFIQGVQDAVNKTPQFSEQELDRLLEAYQSSARSRQIEKIKQEYEKNQLAGDAWLLENSIKPGVVTLSSGLQYKVLKEGTGKTPVLSDRVKCHYRGMLTDGTIFDSSYDRGEAAVFNVSEVIKGWQMALPKMKEHARWMLYIPSNLAYENRGAGEVIQPGMTLIFEVELLQIME